MEYRADNEDPSSVTRHPSPGGLGQWMQGRGNRWEEVRVSRRGACGAASANLLPSLALLSAHELVHLAELGDGGHQGTNLDAEVGLHLVQAHPRVIHHVVQQRHLHRQLSSARDTFAVSQAC